MTIKQRMRIDGKKIAEELFSDLKKRVAILRGKNITPHLVIILVGSNPASVAYVNRKELKAEEIGAKATIINLDEKTSHEDLLSLVKRMSKDPLVHGLIVQRPLPKQIKLNKVNKAVDPKKDVDAFHPKTKFQMPLARAVLRILEEIFTRSHLDQGATLTQWLKSQNIVIIGKGETGGGPTIQLLIKMGIEPKVIDSKTHNPSLITHNADILISAVGRQHVVKATMLKKDVILISVGMHKGTDGKLHGDYEEDEIKSIASFYTPTPGGVGPINVAMLLENLVHAAEI